MGNDWRCDCVNTDADKDPTITIEDPWLGKRTVKANDEVAFINDQLKLLLKMKEQKIERNECLDDINYDIALYRFIVNNKNPHMAANQYLETRHAKGFTKGLVSKKEVVRILGWQEGVISMLIL